MLIGKNHIRGISTSVLLDYGATHSFTSQAFISRVGIITEVSSTGYDVTIPSGEVLFTTSMISGLELELHGHAMKYDLGASAFSQINMRTGYHQLRFIIVFIDDILIYSGSVEEHKRHFQTTSQFLGEQDEIVVDPSKVEAVQSWVNPNNALEIHSFLGLAVPLTYLTKKNTKYVWSPECQRRFNQLKEALTSAPVLAMPVEHEEFVVYHPGKTHVVADALSRKILVITCVSAQRPVQTKIQRFDLEIYSSGHTPSLSALIVQPTFRDRIRGGKSTDEQLYRMRRKDEARGSLLYTVDDGIIKEENQQPAGMLRPFPIPEWKWGKITRDFVIVLPRSARGFTVIWEDFTCSFGEKVIVSNIFIPRMMDSKSKLYRFSRFVEACVIDFQGTWDSRLPLVEFIYNSFQACIGMASYEALYGTR
ncbi:uncharacterized protein [Henckelia pumila]|uniref:uncharacterized protein n=1 Tax=Henckelia pumila TaxID=405737 RepID=UPI003C6DB82A